MSVQSRGLGAALGGLRAVAGWPIVDRLGLRPHIEKVVYTATRSGFGAAAAASRTFGKATSLTKPARQAPTTPKPLFDLTPTEEQQMLQEAFRDFGLKRLRPAALEADTAAAAPAELLTQSLELGSVMLGIPAELGGVLDERSSVTTVLAAEAMAQGDLGLTVAVLAPGAVATALSLWGDADQQATYLPAFTGEDPPVAALCVMEPRPLFDPFTLQTTARRTDDGFVLDGVKSLVPRVAEAELFLVAADLEGTGPALFIVESSTDGLAVEVEPAMGLRAAATGSLKLDGATVRASALLAEGNLDVYREMVHRSRIAWAALAVGTSQAVLDYVIPYVKERHAFGEPVAHRQGVAFLVSDIAVELDGMRLTTYRAASLADQDKPFAQAAAIARELAATKGMQIGSDGVQLLGGHGYVKEHPVERWYRDLRAIGLMEGGLLA
jgi:alkylation response protein AidB-like acyl-CoA dehydrogenase